MVIALEVLPYCIHVLVRTSKILNSSKLHSSRMQVKGIMLVVHAISNKALVKVEYSKGCHINNIAKHSR